MRPGRSRAVAAVLWIAVATAGCGIGPGESSSGEATLTVTHDYGTEPVLEASEKDPSASETVIRFLDREAEITTRYGGGFVQSIDGVSGELADGRSLDWFFFVNGIESPRGAADVTVRGGDRIWWDYRDWTAAMRTPAVVGSWPEPFAQVSAGSERLPVRIECMGRLGPCDAVSELLSEEGVDASIEGRSAPDEPGPALRLLVGPFARVRDDPLAAELEQGPATSGVFARFQPQGDRWGLAALNERGEPAETLGPGAGLVAGLRSGDQPPAWVVTGTDDRGVEEALTLLDAEQLADHYAIAGIAGRELGLPEVDAG